MAIISALVPGQLMWASASPWPNCKCSEAEDVELQSEGLEGCQIETSTDKSREGKTIIDSAAT